MRIEEKIKLQGSNEKLTKISEYNEVEGENQSKKSQSTTTDIKEKSNITNENLESRKKQLSLISPKKVSKDNKDRRAKDYKNRGFRDQESMGMKAHNNECMKDQDNGSFNDKEMVKCDNRLMKDQDSKGLKSQENRCIKNSKSYKRSDSKYSKDKKVPSRSNPNYEYTLDDADEEEKELVLRGTITDRLNVLALLCTRNPSEQNYKQLLQFCENQRNDIIYMTLKLIRDLIKEKIVDSIYIKGRIVKSFEMGCKNQYIKEKVIEIIGVLIRSDIYAEDFINILISRLIEKGNPLNLVENALKSVFSLHESLIFSGLEDFYFKNDDFRCQHNLLKFIQKLEIGTTRKSFFDFYNTALSSLEDYPQDQKDLMVELLVNGLGNNISEGDKIEAVDLIRGYVKSARSIISCLNLLMATKDPYTEAYVIKVSRTSMLRNTKYEPQFLNVIYRINNKDLFAKLIDNSFYYSAPWIISVMLMGYEKHIDLSCMFSLRLFMQHYNPVVKDIATKMLNRERINEFDPYDTVHLEGLTRALCNI